VALAVGSAIQVSGPPISRTVDMSTAIQVASMVIGTKDRMGRFCRSTSQQIQLLYGFSPGVHRRGLNRGPSAYNDATAVFCWPPALTCFEVDIPLHVKSRERRAPIRLTPRSRRSQSAATAHEASSNAIDALVSDLDGDLGATAVTASANLGLDLHRELLWFRFRWGEVWGRSCGRREPWS